MSEAAALEGAAQVEAAPAVSAGWVAPAVMKPSATRAVRLTASGCVIMTGMIGVMLGPWLLDRTGIRSPLARGLALGTISHGQGTAQAALENELSGAIASIALGVAAVFVSLTAPMLLPYLQAGLGLRPSTAAGAPRPCGAPSRSTNPALRSG